MELVCVPICTGGEDSELACVPTCTVVEDNDTEDLTDGVKCVDCRCN